MTHVKSLLLAATFSALAIPAMAEMSAADKTFATKAAAGGLAEVSLGQLAAQKASSDNVKQFARKMATDHAQANQELQQLAEQQKMTLPTQPTSAQRATETRLRGMNGGAFDAAYVDDMLQDHRQDVADFQKEAQSGRDPALKAFAQKYLPVLQNHLKMVETLHTEG